MRYLLSIVLPPLAVLLVGRPGQAILNIFLTCLGWIPGVIHALFLVNEHKQNKRTDKIIKAMKN